MVNKSNAMPRLILVPQYPTKLRYQEWWFEYLPHEFLRHFDSVITLGGFIEVSNLTTEDATMFSPVETALEFEALQIQQYSSLEITEKDILLLCDLSFPGLFPQVLFHKRPKKCFAICHATSLNAYDYYMKDRQIKYPIEKNTAQLFDKVFVGSQYHANKLGWKNICYLVS